MVKKIIKIIRDRKDHKEQVRKIEERKVLEKKVEQGSDFVIQEYGEALRKLGAYDRQ